MNIYSAAQKFEKIKSKFIRNSAIHITDDKTVLIENCSIIESFDENCITVVLSKNAAVITGIELKVNSYSNNNIIIRGKIHSIKMIEKDNK